MLQLSAGLTPFLPSPPPRSCRSASPRVSEQLLAQPRGHLALLGGAVARRPGGLRGQPGGAGLLRAVAVRACEPEAAPSNSRLAARNSQLRCLAPPCSPLPCPMNFFAGCRSRCPPRPPHTTCRAATTRCCHHRQAPPPCQLWPSSGPPIPFCCRASLVCAPSPICSSTLQIGGTACSLYCCR